MTSNKLNHAIQFLKEGNKQAALPILKEIIQNEPNNEIAWLCLSSCLDDISQKKYCLNQTLEINPDNQNARNALTKLTNQASPPAPKLERPPVIKPVALLEFLKATATLRHKRIPAYGAGDTLWLGNVPQNRTECHSAFLADNPSEIPDLWLEIRKRSMPIQSPVPEVLKDWVRPQDLEQAKNEPELLPEITILVEKDKPDPEIDRMVIEKVAEVRHLKDNLDVEAAWHDYLVKCWKPWAQEMLLWQEVQQVYEDVDFMRRRLEEAEERYEVVLAVGLLQWRDSTGTSIKRHLLTAPVEISLDAARGILTVTPAASFDEFRVELDMLEFQSQPRLEGMGLDTLLEDLDVQAWDRPKVGKILGIIANRADPGAQVDENALKPLERADAIFRVVYAPALVLRERRPTAYEELIKRFLTAAENESTFPTTAPWEHFVREGEPSITSAGVQPHEDFRSGDPEGRLYFPLPTNEEQRQIVDRLKAQPCVLVKGPPGTGKSHTIANLICHLLASGNRVLVTAHAPKALAVLRELLPLDIRDLCVTAFGSTRYDQRLLGDSVRGILSRKNEWKGDKWTHEKITELSRELYQFEDRRAKVDNNLRESREAETYSHTLWGGYQGTAAQIARQLEQSKQEYEWFPDLPEDQTQFPLGAADILCLADVNSRLSEDRLNELRLDIGSFPLIEPEIFQQTIVNLQEAEHTAEITRKGLSQEQLDALLSFSNEDLEICRAFLQSLEECAIRASRILGDLTNEIVKDLLVGRETRWNELSQGEAPLLESMKKVHDSVKDVTIEIPSDANYQQLLSDAERRIEHFMSGGRRGLGFLAPRVIRETRYIEECCRVEDQAPRELESLQKLISFLELRKLVEQFSQAWPIPNILINLDTKRAARDAQELVQELNCLLELFKNQGSRALAIFPIREGVTLYSSDEREKWIKLIHAEISSRRARQLREPLEGWLRLIYSLPDGVAHPCMQQLAQAIEEHSLEGWKEAWKRRESFKAEKEHYQHYQELVASLEKKCPGLEKALRFTQGNPEWKERLLQIDKAWAWSAARAWLRRVTNSNTYQHLKKERQQLEGNIEKKIEELVAQSAWQAFFARLDAKTEQNLKAWTKAVDRIGKGTGKYAYRHRKTARQYLMACIPKIPAWIMPLHKLWDTVDAQAGLFDTVIIDEASQAGIESLALLLLAKRIVVVGDDKQNSPEAVGVLENDIARLAHDHLREFRFRDEFRPDTSLFDHAERVFGNLISLREHFRCVPEIIRFSNDLCYTDSPLIPLRQPPPNRLQPLCARFVDTGDCEGEGQRIINRAEADEIVNTIKECLEDDAYKGKTMGVIVLQGHSQAELIDKKLAEVLEPKILEERKLRCGVPATFQGDQRDVIFLSLVIAPKYHYRALTGLPDQRRYNVAMSRAKDQVWFFHSLQQHDLNREDLRWRLLNFFYAPGRGELEGLYEESDYLEREAKRSPRQLGEQPAPFESWFEVDVVLELLRRKFRVRPQYEVAGYRLDLVVEGIESRLAVECDGDAWHGPERYEHDMARQRQLERARWSFVRINESEFYADRSRAVAQILEECERLGIRPID